MTELSQDVRAVYRAFGRSDLSYQEVAVELKYREVVKKWPLLRTIHAPSLENAGRVEQS
ncbi:MAG TPA: hypothetical protein DIW43_06050 [Spongiibacteraceae bacterium]|nr:hypothetical protein [Spongiibacteraceae bacterium]|tara:strand:+ start:257 stop:433 length:177 start_codon:yes stop_codon:yes gene_type:complete